MQIKRFEAKNMTEALTMIKRELGPEAVILSAKDVRRENRLLGLSRKVGVEVTAAVDDKYPNPSAPRLALRSEDDTVKRSSYSGAALGCGIHHVRDVVRIARNHRDGRRAAATPHEPAPSSSGTADTAAPSYRSGEAASAPPVIERLQAMGLKLTGWPASNGKPVCVALVGAAGVGKTTTIVKLAAQLRYEAQRSVGLISLDHCKIGGFETLREHAAIMGLETHAPRCLKSLRKAMRRLQTTDVVLIDTPAVDHRGGEASIPLLAAMPSVAAVTVWLVVSAETKEEDLRDAAQRVEALAPRGVIVTKTDLTRSFAAVVNFLGQSGLPLAWLGTGAAIPQDLAAATYDQLVGRLLERGGRPSLPPVPPSGGEDFQAPASAAGAASGETYLANKSSDVFHRVGCKWIRLINRDHIVAFGSFAEALNNRFKPCRYCNPQSMPIAHLLREEPRAL